MKSRMVVGLDVGTSSIKMVAAQKRAEASDIEILGIGEEASAGVRKGSIVNAEETAKKIFALKMRMENVTARKIENVIASIGGSHIFITPSRGIVAVSRADGQISQEDIDRVMQAAQALSLSNNKEILDVFARQYIVDGQEGVRDAVGMRGVRLEAEVSAVCGFAPYIKNLTDAAVLSGLEIEEMLPVPLAIAAATLTVQQKELGVAIVDMGAGTTSLAVFEEGELLHIAVFPVGSEHITHDIAIGLRTEPEVAERAKKEFGSCIAGRGKKAEKIELPDGSVFSFSQKMLVHIIEARTKEIFQLVNKELKKIGKQGNLPSGIVLTGGGAKLPRIVDFAKKEFRLPAKVGTAQNIFSPQEDPAFLCALGLAVRGMELQEFGGRGYRGPGSGAFDRVKKVLRVFIP